MTILCHLYNAISRTNGRTRKIKRTIRGLFSLIFGLFQAKINTILTSCEKCQSSTRCHDSNPQPLDCKSHPITTRPVLVMKNCFIAFLRRFILTYSHFIIFVLRRQTSSVINYLLSEKMLLKEKNIFGACPETFFQLFWVPKIFLSKFSPTFFIIPKTDDIMLRNVDRISPKIYPKRVFYLKPFTRITNPLGPSPHPTECTSPSYILLTATGSNQA